MSRKPDVHVPTLPLPLEKAEEVRMLLEQVLGNRLFRSSRRCQILLRYITEQTLAGETSSLKERTLGIEVFGRAADYDTSQDPIVRASAAEIRKKLAQYYQEPGHESETRIELLSGSYIAEFHFIGSGNGSGAASVAGVAGVVAPSQPLLPASKPGVVAPSQPLLPTSEPDAPAPSRMRYAAIAGGAAAAVALLIMAFTLALPGWRRSDLDELWSPVLKAAGTVLICVGQPVAYNLRSAQAQDAMQGFEAPQPPGSPSAQRVIREQDLIILADRYVALGDAVCLVHLTSLLDRYRKPYRIRGERSTSFADLRDTPAVLIAAFDNPWTLRTAGQLRFTFSKDSAHDTDMVRDRQHPENTEWKLTQAWPNWDIPNDYAIVSRILDTTTDRPVVIAAGITQYGTMAAGEFLTSPEYFSEAVRQFPRDWQKKNLQIVLRVPVVHRISGRPRILATHVW
ncbi:MAG TPA: hypothetical protein VKJ01_01950 [Candidatus Solibacter sp.]|nr:hypothetical protein [Candidatus Solibacter sp.]